jgi:hypothetical protein
LQDGLTPAGVPGSDTPREIHAIEAGHPGVVDSNVDVGRFLVVCDLLAGGDPVVGGLGPVRDREVLWEEFPSGKGDVPVNAADVVCINRLGWIFDSVVDE